jgi:hypothetical protein
MVLVDMVEDCIENQTVDLDFFLGWPFSSTGYIIKASIPLHMLPCTQTIFSGICK